MSLLNLIGKRVKVKATGQRCFGKPKCPNRIGMVIKQNPCAANGDLFYVRLEKTARSDERMELFWCDDLEVIELPAVHNLGEQS